MFPILSTVFISSITFILWSLFKRRQLYQLRAKIGLAGPEPHWFYGNLLEIVDRKEKLGYDDTYNWVSEMHKKFGSIFGAYFGPDLSILLSDEEDVKEIYIKNFSNFSDRYQYPILTESHLTTSLLYSTYENGWKNMRSTVGPIFASGKMRTMHETINSKIDTFLEILEEKSATGSKWDIYEDFQALTLEVIGKCAFAIDSNCQRDRTEMFYVQAQKYIYNMDMKRSTVVTASVMFPELISLLRPFYKFTGLACAEKPLVEGLSAVYELRRSGEGSDSVDLLKLLLDREDHKTHKMTKQEVIENCFAFLLAGYETTSTALTYCAYLLSRNPEIQEQLYQEIMEVKGTSGLDYDSIHGMKYLDAVYKETLRLYPPVIHFINRVCLADCTIRGQFIPKDAVVSVLPYMVHRNPDNWERPDEFLPDRFIGWDEKGSLKWIPFGVGPRFCVGMRFAEMEFKTTIVKMLEKFEMSMDEGEEPLVPACNGIIMRPKEPVRVTLSKRAS